MTHDHPLMTELDTLMLDTLINDLPKAQPASIDAACYKSCPNDFVVNERLATHFSFAESGEHLWLQVQKSGINTQYIAQSLASWAGIPLRDVGYSGLKDRHALTTQWFSLRLPNRQLPETPWALPASSIDDTTTQYEHARLLDQHWHNKKLNRGTHASNAFVITLRHVCGQPADIEQQLSNIAEQGVPNYFGGQRFGNQGSNVSAALRYFATAKPPLPTQAKHHQRNRQPKKTCKQNRDRQSLLISAARSLIFNRILAQRVKDGSWNTGLDGEVFNLNGTGSVFASSHMDAQLTERLRTGDIHPTAALWGIGNDKVEGAAKDLEDRVVADHATLSALADGLESQQIKAHRRSLRLPVANLHWQWLPDTPRHQTATPLDCVHADSKHSTNNNNTADTLDTPATLQLSFELPAGCFATSVLQAVITNLRLGNAIAADSDTTS